MPIDIHQTLIKHYKKIQNTKQKKTVKKQSVVRQVYTKKIIQIEEISPKEDFLKNQQHLYMEQYPLNFRKLPRALKVYFPGPPQPPPILPEIPYSYESVPNVPYKIPKQKPGIVNKWILDTNRNFNQTQSLIESNKNLKQKNIKINDKRHHFRILMKKLLTTMRQQNLSLKQIIKNKGLIKKSYNFHNSIQFFTMIKKGDLDSERLLKNNPNLAYDIDGQKMTALHWSARQGHTDIVKILLQKYHASPMSKDLYGRTPLHFAVAQKKLQCIIRIFIEGGKLTSLNNNKESVRQVAPDAYTRYLLQKLEEVRFILKTKAISDHKIYKEQLEINIRAILDQESQYF